MIVTEFAVFSLENNRMTLLEIAPEVTLEDIRENTEAEFLVADPLKIMQGVEGEKDE